MQTIAPKVTFTPGSRQGLVVLSVRREKPDEDGARGGMEMELTAGDVARMRGALDIVADLLERGAW